MGEPNTEQDGEEFGDDLVTTVSLQVSMQELRILLIFGRQFKSVRTCGFDSHLRHQS
jgi:hypothetical protein